ncbi:MAG TPA: amidase, partial [Nannocystis exedens]|nr:amidase [Nannocystis exedens]
MASFSEYSDYDALGLAALVRRGEVHPSELLEACLERIDRWNPELGAVVLRIDHLARKAAESELPEGPFRGVPFLV